MEFSVLAAGIHARRQVGEKRFVELASGRRTDRRTARVNANGDRSKTLADKILGEFARVTLPDGKQRVHPNHRQIPLSVYAQVFEENIAEGYLPHASCQVLDEGLLHSLLVYDVNALRRNQDRLQRQADGGSLPLEQNAAHSVHADAVVLLGDGCEQRDNALLARHLNRMQRHGAVFSLHSSRTGRLLAYSEPQSWRVVYFTPMRNSLPRAGYPTSS